MITKEVAKKIWIAYNEIEQAKLMLEELKKSVNEEGQFELKDEWNRPARGLELRIPTTTSGHTIKYVPFSLAVDVINSHVVAQEKELERLKDVCKVQLS